MDLGFLCPRLYKKVSGNESSFLGNPTTQTVIYFNTYLTEGKKVDDVKASHGP